MANVNRGKKFEEIFRECVEEVVGSAILRLHDQTTGYAGSKNPCDFIVYKAPYMYAIECKSVHGNRLPFANITDYQWSELKKLGDVQGVIAGVVCWWIDKDVTLFLPIATLWELKCNGAKSVSYEIESDYEFLTYTIKGRKKRVFFEYDMRAFFNEIEHPVIDTIMHPV